MATLLLVDDEVSLLHSMKLQLSRAGYECHCAETMAGADRLLKQFEPELAVIDIRLPAWARRLVTRSLAIVPAALVTIWYGASGTAKLLIFSQVILSIQLPFAIVPLVMFTADRGKLGELIAPRWLTALAALTAVTVIVLNIKLLVDFLAG